MWTGQRFAAWSYRSVRLLEDIDLLRRVIFRIWWFSNVCTAAGILLTQADLIEDRFRWAFRAFMLVYLVSHLPLYIWFKLRPSQPVFAVLTAAVFVTTRFLFSISNVAPHQLLGTEVVLFTLALFMAMLLLEPPFYLTVTTLASTVMVGKVLSVMAETEPGQWRSVAVSSLGVVVGAWGLLNLASWLLSHHHRESARAFAQLAAQNERLERAVEHRAAIIRRQQEHLSRAARMEALGTLAGGIAHDFNNLLMGIQGSASLMQVESNRCAADVEYLANIERCAKSGAELTSQLLGFARSGKYNVVTLDLDRLVDSTLQLFGSAKRQVVLDRQRQEALWPVHADKVQLERVLLNLFNNAAHAMPGGGRMHVETHNVELPVDHQEAIEIPAGRYVHLTVRDEGVGMDAKTLERVFEPFFTSRKDGTGTGLGLATAFGIIKNHDGFIIAKSQLGQGTTMDVYLPACDEPLPEESAAPQAFLPPGDWTVLLVDDEDCVRDVTQNMLETVGCTVLAARNGPETLELFRARQGQIDLVILDMTMPGMSGAEVFDALRAIDSQVKVLLSSGYSAQEHAAALLSRGCNGFLGKPYGVADLVTKLVELLTPSTQDRPFRSVAHCGQTPPYGQ